MKVLGLTAACERNVRCVGSSHDPALSRVVIPSEARNLLFLLAQSRASGEEQQIPRGLKAARNDKLCVEKALLVLALATALAVLSFAQGEFNPKPPEVFATPVGSVTVAPGSSVKVPLTFRLSEGYHINSNVPRSELLIPTVLALHAPSPQVSIRIAYPKGEDVAFDFEPNQKLSVYEGEFIITARIRAARAATPGVHTVRGTLKYQACNDRACFPPKTLPVEFQLAVEKPARASRRR